MSDGEKISTWASLIPEVVFDLNARILPGFAAFLLVLILRVDVTESASLGDQFEEVMQGAHSAAATSFFLDKDGAGVVFAFILFLLASLAAGHVLGLVGRLFSYASAPIPWRLVRARHKGETAEPWSELPLGLGWRKCSTLHRIYHDEAKGASPGYASLLPKLSGEASFFWNLLALLLIGSIPVLLGEALSLKWLWPLYGTSVILLLGGVNKQVGLIERQLIAVEEKRSRR